MVRWLMLDSTAMPYLPPLFRVMREMGATIAYAGTPGPGRFQALEAVGVECHALRVRSKLDFLAWRRMRQLARAFKPDVVHSIGGRDAFVAVRARGRVHDHAIIARRGAYPFISPFDPVDRIVYGARGVTRFVTVSRALEQVMANRGIAPERLRTIDS